MNTMSLQNTPVPYVVNVYIRYQQCGECAFEARAAATPFAFRAWNEDDNTHTEK